METPLHYREGTLADKEQLMQIAVAAYSPFAAVLAPEQWARMDGFLHDEEKLIALINQSKCFACLDGDRIVGVAYFIPHGNPWDIFPAEWSYVRMVGVHPDYRGRGIARTLTAQCIAQARATGEKIIALHTSEYMDAARHVYESLGFRVLKEIEPRFGKRYWLYTIDL